MGYPRSSSNSLLINRLMIKKSINYLILSMDRLERKGAGRHGRILVRPRDLLV